MLTPLLKALTGTRNQVQKFAKVGGKIVPVASESSVAQVSSEPPEEAQETKPPKPQLRKALAALQKHRAKRLEQVQREREKVPEGKI